MNHNYYVNVGLDNSRDVSNRTGISNTKYVTSWRAQHQRYNNGNAIDENDANNTQFHNSNGIVNGCTENGQEESFYKRTSLHEKYPVRTNGIRKVNTSFQEDGNGNKIDFHDIHENQTMKPNQFRYEIGGCILVI